MYFLSFLIIFLSRLCFCAPVELGIDCFLKQNYPEKLKNKRIGLITNHTGVNSHFIPTATLLKEHLNLVAIFSPEHGFSGMYYAAEKISKENAKNQTPIFSLYGKTRRPTQKMLKDIDVLIYDIQDIGVRSYTFATTLFYVMEEAAKRNIPMIVLDRPNPINGLLIDGTMLENHLRSFIGYINVPYCHGMTIGELALFFNNEYKIGCSLTIVPMKGWHRSMSFKETGLHWIPTSPHIPESDTPFFYATTGILGELNIINHGVGYTLPFKVVGAPWIDADKFATTLNQQNLSGVHFMPFHYRPFYGKFKGENCHGILIRITDKTLYRPQKVQYFILGILKSLYPSIFNKRLKALKQQKKKLFCQTIGNQEFFRLISEEKYITWKMISYQEKDQKNFTKIRKKYLISSYACPKPSR